MPENRPTAQELLQSGLLFQTIDPKAFNEFIEISLNPKNSENNMLLCALFEKPNPRHIDFTYDLSGGIFDNPKKINRKIEALIRSNIINKLRTSFEQSGAIEINSPMILPYSKHISILQYQRDMSFKKVLIENKKEATFMDPSGIIVQLSNNSLVSWARTIPKTNIKGLLKRFTVSKVYKALGAGEHPEESLEASLDFCYDPEHLNSFRYIYEAELLKITLLTLDQFASKLPMIEVTVNDSRLIDCILDFCEINDSNKIKVLGICKDIHRRKWANIKKELIESGISLGSAERMGYFFRLREDLSTMIEILKKNSI